MVYDDKIINEIVNEMLNGTFSVFCGAGATYDATKREWKDIFDNKTKDFYDNKCSTDLYFLADLEKRYYNNNSFLDDISNKLISNAKLQSLHISNIVKLNINQIWTTNFDTIIEKTIQKELKFMPVVIKDSADLFTKDLNSCYLVYKLNGCVTKPKTMVLTKDNYFDYFKKQRLIFEMLKRQLVLDSFLFVGYSFTDDLVLNALREIKDVFPKRGKKHFRFAKRAKTTTNNKIYEEYQSLEIRYFQDKYNIKTILIDDYDDIDIYLQKFYERFCNHNVLIAGSFRQLENNNKRIYIESLIGSIVQKLTTNNYNIYSGNGRGLGEIVVAQVNKYNAEKHFVNRPLIFANDNTKQKNIKNHLIMRDCDTMIIVCGQDDTLGPSKNVFNQFKIFMNNHSKKIYPLLIPLPTTEYAAKKIFDSEEFRSSNVYLSNKHSFDELSKCHKIDRITQIVMDLIKSYKSANS